jgi:hypothetical protein
MAAKTEFWIDIAIESVSGATGYSCGNKIKRNGGCLPQAWP